MYLTITPQKLSGKYSQSSADFVAYLEKENRELSPTRPEPFFNQHHSNISAEEVIASIDGNTAKLKRSEPKYYSITINPSRRELVHIGNNKQKLKEYTREIMKNYAQAFHREIHGRPVRVDDIRYFAKVETRRTYKGTDREIKENLPFLKKIAALENTLRKVEKGAAKGNCSNLKKQLERIYKDVPHKINGQPIEPGMPKLGSQTHVHVIVSRKDISNSFSLSPGSKYRASEVVMHGKVVKRGFERDRFFREAEKTFDRIFNYNRNYVESYQARKIFSKDPKQYYSHLHGLTPAQKRLAFTILKQADLNIPNLNISPGQFSFALKQVRKALEIAIRSSSIGY